VCYTALIEKSTRHLSVNLSKTITFFGTCQVIDKHEASLVGLDPLLESTSRLCVSVEFLSDIKDM